MWRRRTCMTTLRQLSRRPERLQLETARDLFRRLAVRSLG
jgi:hypothetical protein